MKRKGKPFKGAGVINTSGDGQSAGAKLAQGQEATFTFRYTNADPLTEDDFNVGDAPRPVSSR